MKQSFIIIILFSSLLLKLNGQHVELKRLLTTNDRSYFSDLIQDCFKRNGSLEFKFYTQDFYDTKNLKPDTAYSEKHINVLKKQLKGTDADALIYYSIALELNGLYKNEEASNYFDSAIRINQAILNSYPDAMAAYHQIADIYQAIGAFGEAIETLQKALAVNPSDTIAEQTLPMLYMFSGQNELAAQAIDFLLKKHPDNLDYYIEWSVCAVLNKSSALMAYDLNQLKTVLQNKSPEEILNLDILTEACNKHKNNIKFELLLELTKHIILLSKTMMLTTNDSSFAEDNFKFIIDAKDIKEFKELEKFYLSCIKNEALENKYIVNAALGNLYLLLGDNQKTIQFMKEAIHQKPINKSTFQYNPDIDYNNLAAAYRIFNDSVNYEKTILEKLKVRPAINSNPVDYLNAALVYFFNADHKKAKKYAMDALKITDNYPDAHRFLGAEFIISNESERAQQELTKCLQSDSSNKDTWLLLAINDLYKGNISASYSEFQKLKELEGGASWIDKEILNAFFKVK